MRSAPVRYRLPATFRVWLEITLGLGLLLVLLLPGLVARAWWWARAKRRRWTMRRVLLLAACALLAVASRAPSELVPVWEWHRLDREHYVLCRYGFPAGTLRLADGVYLRWLPPAGWQRCNPPYPPSAEILQELERRRRITWQRQGPPGDRGRETGIGFPSPGCGPLSPGPAHRLTTTCQCAATCPAFFPGRVNKSTSSRIN